MVAAEVKSNFPLAMIGRHYVGAIALDAMLPNVAFERFKELPAAVGAEANGGRELPQDGAFQKGLGDGSQLALAVDEDFHIFFVAGLQLDVGQDFCAWLIVEERATTVISALAGAGVGDQRCSVAVRY